MTRRKSTSLPFLVPSVNHSARSQARSLLEAELREIRRTLAQLERELESNVTEIGRPRRQQRDSEVA
jgi:hypothetical protein